MKRQRARSKPALREAGQGRGEWAGQERGSPGRVQLAYVSIFPTTHRPGLPCAALCSLCTMVCRALEATAAGRMVWAGMRQVRDQGVVCALQPRFKQLHTTTKCEKTRKNKFAPRKQTNTRTNDPQRGHRRCLSLHGHRHHPLTTSFKPEHRNTHMYVF